MKGPWFVHFDNGTGWRWLADDRFENFETASVVFRFYVRSAPSRAYRLVDAEGRRIVEIQPGARAA